MDEDNSRFLYSVLVGAAAAIIAILTVLIVMDAAKAHQAPLGWQYPLSCCSNQDCREANSGEVRETPEGYQLITTGETVPYGNKRIKDSPDGRFHVCQQGGDFDTGRILCIFVPPRGF